MRRCRLVPAIRVAWSEIVAIAGKRALGEPVGIAADTLLKRFQRLVELLD
jgi:hypothetical protein